jgi:hypothetical protein
MSVSKLQLKCAVVLVYSGISVYRSRNVHFLVFIVRHLWSRIKFHINNVIYFCIHRSPDLSFSAFIVVNHVPDTAFATWIFLHGLFVKNNWSELFMWDPCCAPAPHVADCMYVQSTRIYLCYIIYASHVTFSFESSIFAFSVWLWLYERNVLELCTTDWK